MLQGPRWRTRNSRQDHTPGQKCGLAYDRLLAQAGSSVTCCGLEPWSVRDMDKHRAPACGSVLELQSDAIDRWGWTACKPGPQLSIFGPHRHINSLIATPLDRQGTAPLVAS